MNKIVFYKECENPSVEIGSKIRYMDPYNAYYHIPVNGYIEPAIYNMSDMSIESNILIILEIIKNMYENVGEYDIYLVGCKCRNLLQESVKIDRDCGNTNELLDFLEKLYDISDGMYMVDLFMLVTSDSDYEHDFTQLQTEIDSMFEDGDCWDENYLYELDQYFGSISSRVLTIENRILSDCLSDRRLVFNSSVPRFIHGNDYRPLYCMIDCDHYGDKHTWSYINEPKLPVLFSYPKTILTAEKYNDIGRWIRSCDKFIISAVLNSILITAAHYNSEIYVNRRQITESSILNHGKTMTVDDFFEFVKNTLVTRTFQIIPERIDLEILRHDEFYKLAEINPAILTGYDDIYPVIRVTLDNLITTHHLPLKNISLDNPIRIE